MLAIVPVKARNGKSRLDGFLSAGERARLVEAMLADVLAACAEANATEATLVVTPDAEAAPGGVEVLVDEGVGHAEAIARALADPRAGAGVLVVMADCPLVRPESLDRLAGAARPVALAPATDGGMNALALRPGVSLDAAFGVPDAARVTLARARARGLEPAVLEDPALAFDVDDPPDVWRLRESAEETRARAALEEILPPTGGLR